MKILDIGDDDLMVISQVLNTLLDTEEIQNNVDLRFELIKLKRWISDSIYIKITMPPEAKIIDERGLMKIVNT